MNFINPKIDYAFKKIFGSKESHDILVSFLNAILYDGQPVIESLEILNPYLAPKIKGFKDTYLDVHACLNSGEDVIIEMQVLNLEGFEKRILYNAAKAYSLQLETGQEYTLLNPVIALTITDFKMFEDLKGVISRFVLLEKTRLVAYPIDDLELVFVELPKFKKDLDELQTLMDKWLYFIKWARKLDDVPEVMGEVPEIQQAFRIARETNLSQDELNDLEKREFFIQDMRRALATVRRGIQEAQQKAQEAYVEGHREGLGQGRQEERVALARRLLDVLDAEIIAQKTGLSLAEVQELRSAF